MDPKFYGVVEMVFFGTVVLGLGAWQLVSIRRELKRDREKSQPPSSPER